MVLLNPDDTLSMYEGPTVGAILVAISSGRRIKSGNIPFAVGGGAGARVSASIPEPLYESLYPEISIGAGTGAATGAGIGTAAIRGMSPPKPPTKSVDPGVIGVDIVGTTSSTGLARAFTPETEAPLNILGEPYWGTPLRVTPLEVGVPNAAIVSGRTPVALVAASAIVAAGVTGMGGGVTAVPANPCDQSDPTLSIPGTVLALAKLSISPLML